MPQIDVNVNFRSYLIWLPLKCDKFTNYAVNCKAYKLLEGWFKMKIDAIMIEEQDNVATALRDIAQGEVIVVGIDDQRINVRAGEHIAYGHKLAMKDIPKGENIVKYGEVIGRATQTISAGTHAHIHNIESLRGRGDLEIGDS
jgi:altronate dehydratase small subunit